MRAIEKNARGGRAPGKNRAALPDAAVEQPPACADDKPNKPPVSQEARALVEQRLPELLDKSWVRRNRAPTAKLAPHDEGVTLEVGRARGPGGKEVNDASAALIFNASLGTTDPAFSDVLVKQIINGTANRDGADPEAFGFAMAVVQGIEPRDEVEALLATQMAAVHSASMMMARRLALAETIPQQDSAERAFNKCARTFTTQMEALKRYRSTGEQKVTVQHVTVNEGGQAVVGSVTTGGREDKKNDR